jgi:hypothetical protein
MMNYLYLYRTHRILSVKKYDRILQITITKLNTVPTQRSRSHLIWLNRNLDIKSENLPSVRCLSRYQHWDRLSLFGELELSIACLCYKYVGLGLIEKNMLSKIVILTGLSVATLGLTNLAADSQTVQQGTQDAYIQGDDNEVNQIINQYYFNNPGKGVIKRKESVTEPNNSLLTNGHPQASPFHGEERVTSSDSNVQPRNSNNREWGHNQGVQRRSAKK